LSGSANVTIAPDGTGGSLWTVTSTGVSTNTAGGTISNTATATVQVNSIFQAVQALASNAAVNLNSKISVSGSPTAIVTPLAVTVTGIAHITGMISSTSVTGDLGASTEAAPAAGIVPDYTLVRSYATYTYGTHSYAAAHIVTLGNSSAGPGNPAGIFEQTTGSVTLTGPMTITGTLYVPKGSINIVGSVTINPAVAGYPAIVTNGAINFTGILANSLTTTGLVFAENGIGTGNAASTVNITGGLLSTTTPISGSYNGSAIITYNATDVSAPDLTSSPAYETPQSVKMVTYAP
jgi:hypothetical protein